MHPKRVKEKEEEEIAEVNCPIAKITVVECPCTTCLWHDAAKPGKCGFSERADETDQAVKLGMSLEEMSAEVRRSKAAIQKILILDKYIEHVRQEIQEKPSRLSALEADHFLASLKGKSLAWNPLFKMDLQVFVELCRKQNYKTFVKKNEGMVKIKLASILGLRESVIHKVVARNKVLSRKKNTLSGSHKSKSQ